MQEGKSGNTRYAQDVSPIPKNWLKTGPSKAANFEGSGVLRI